MAQAMADLTPDNSPSLDERLAAGSADDVEQALRQIHDWRPLPANLADALLLAADLCAAVREFMADAKAGERKGLAKCDHAVIMIQQDKTDRGPMVVAISDAFKGEPGGRIMLTRREALVIEGSDGIPRVAVRRMSW